VQTDGPRNFDRPVPVRFPNLPDATTGEKLPPGAKSALWSFITTLGNGRLSAHDRFDDGLFLFESDPVSVFGNRVGTGPSRARVDEVVRRLCPRRPTGHVPS